MFNVLFTDRKKSVIKIYYTIKTLKYMGCILSWAPNIPVIHWGEPLHTSVVCPHHSAFFQKLLQQTDVLPESVDKLIFYTQNSV